VLCRELFIDPARQDYTIVSPVHQVFAQRYPLQEAFSVFARWSNAHGSNEIKVQLRSLEGDVLCSCKREAPFEARDPLQIWMIPLHHLLFQFPEPGKYQVAMLANGQEVPSDTVRADRVRPAG
jgi:hypothetical protein